MARMVAIYASEKRLSLSILITLRMYADNESDRCHLDRLYRSLDDKDNVAEYSVPVELAYQLTVACMDAYPNVTFYLTPDLEFNMFYKM